MKKYVLDASVILKWVLGEDKEADQKSAWNILNAWVNGSVELAAPTLWQYEVGNFLGRELHHEAAEKMDSLLELGIKSVDLNERITGRCFTWMQKNKVTFYDASYLAVAVEIQALLVTADEKFVRKMSKIGPISLLRDLEL